MAEQQDTPQGAHFYQLRLKCRDTVIDLDSQDPAFIDRQMRQWLGILTGPNTLPLPPVAPQPKPEAFSQSQPDSESIKDGGVVKAAVDSPSPKSLQDVLSPNALELEGGQELLPVSPAVPRHLSGVSHQSSDATPAVEELPLEPDEDVEEAAPQTFDGDATDLSERLEPREEELDLVVNTLMEDLQPPPEERSHPVQSTVQQSFEPLEQDSHDGEAVQFGDESNLSHSVDSTEFSSQVQPSAQPEQTASQTTLSAASGEEDVVAYEVLCNQVGAATAEDFLLMGAYYVTVHQQMSPFTLTVLNKLITSAGFEPVNHTVLATALTKGLLTMVPDVHGTAEATEYEITPHGRSTVEMFL